MSKPLPADVRRLMARRAAIVKQIESINEEIRGLERSTGLRASRLLRMHTPRRRR